MSDCSCNDKHKKKKGCDCFGHGVKIPVGPDGDNGLNAYQIWLELGNTGTEQDFIDSLTGPQGEEGPEGPEGPAGTVTPLVWNTLTMNGVFTSLASPNVAQYCIDPYGYLHFRGRVQTSAGAAGGAISDMSAILTANTKDHALLCIATNSSTTIEEVSVSSAGILSSTFISDEPLSLETIPAIYILD